nr:sporulation YhaL family protein [uncultured Bacillus sp.]
MDLPFWLYLIVMGILISAYMTVKTGKEEKRLEEEIIEREGQVYMERLEKERSGKGEPDEVIRAEESE